MKNLLCCLLCIFTLSAFAQNNQNNFPGGGGGGGSFTAGGDLTGTSSSQTVSKLQGSTLTLTTPAGGQELSLTSTGIFVNKNPLKWDATLFHSASGCGTDAGCDAQNAFAFLANNGLNLGGTVTLENETTIDIQHNPFCGNTSFGTTLSPNLTPVKVQLVISDRVLNTLEVPLGMMAGGCKYTTLSPGHAVLSGPSLGVGGGANLVAGAMLKMGASYPKAGSTTSPCTGCNTYSGTVAAVTDDGTAGSGASGCGWNFGGASGTGRVCVTGTSTHFTTELTVEGIFAAPHNLAANQVYGHIDEIEDDTHLTLTTQYANQTGAISGVGYSVAYPMVEWAIGGQGWLGSVNQGLVVQDLTIDANNNAGSWGFINLAGAELNTLHNVHIQKFVSAGLVVAGNIPQSNTSDTIFLNPSSSCEAANSLDLLVGERSSGFATSAPFGFDTILFAAGVCDSATDGITPFIINGGNFAMNNFHVERSAQGYIGHVLACTTFPCPETIYAVNTSVPTNIALTNGNYSCQSCSISPTAGLEIGNSFAPPQTVTIQNMQVVATYTDSLIDDNNSNTLTRTNNGSIGIYRIDQTGKVSETDANPADTLSNVALDCYNGSCRLPGSASIKVVGTDANGVLGNALGSAVLSSSQCNDASGSGTAQSCSTSPSFSTSTGSAIVYSTTTTNTGDVTLAFNGGAAKHIRKWLGAATLAAGDLPANTPVWMMYDGTFWEIMTIGNAPAGGVASVNTLTGAVVIEAATTGQMAVSGGSGAALTGAADMTYSTHTFATTTSGIFDWSAATGVGALKFPAVVGGTVLTGTVTAALSAPAVFQNTNSSNNNSSMAAIFTAPGTSTGQVTAMFNGATTGAALIKGTTGGTVASGAISGQTDQFVVLPTGATIFGAGINPTTGTSGGEVTLEGTAFTGTSTNYGWYNDSTLHCFDIIDQTTNIGCAIGETAIVGANLVLKAVGTTSKAVGSSITDDGTVITASEFANFTTNRVFMVADWTCGTGGTVSSCTTATIVGSTGTPLTLTLPSSAQSWHWHCHVVVTDTTATPANNWNMITSSHGATNITASYSGFTAAAVAAGGSTTDTASTTTTFSIGGTWTQGATATKMPYDIDAWIEGASASGTTVSLQVVDPTVGDLLTIYRGAWCSVGAQ